MSTAVTASRIAAGAGQLNYRFGVGINERRKPRRVARRRPLLGVEIVEGDGFGAAKPGVGSGDAEAAANRAAELEQRLGGRKRAGDAEEISRRRAYRRLGSGVAGVVGAEDSEDEATALGKLPMDFAADFFGCPMTAKPPPATLVRAAAARLPDGEQPMSRTLPEKAATEAWLRHLQLGFSVLVQGVGSKKRLLDTFVDEVLVPWGAAVIRVHAFDARLSLADCLRTALEQLHPEVARAGHSADALVVALASARRSEAEGSRPLCIVVDNLECLPPGHQAALSSLAATRGVHFVASVDSVWASLAWTPRVSKDFNFCREERHTFESYEVENVARFPNGLPAWCDPFAMKHKARKTSLALVLRSLTRSHRELVQAIAEHQLEAGGRTGISQSRLLTEATDRMIASTATKLKALLNELRDHEVVAQRGGADGGMLLYLTCDTKVLQKLAKGQDLEASDDESEGDIA